MTFNAVEFDQIARNIFFPIYPVIAEQILHHTQGMHKGLCMDIGCGTGYLGFAIAQKTEMTLCLYDISEEALSIADQNIEQLKLQDRAFTCLGDAEDIQYTDAFADLVISRGSLFFWQDQKKAINEIYRVIKPGGWAYLGGGFGNLVLKNEIDEKMLAIDDQWTSKAAKRKGSTAHYQQLMDTTMVESFRIKEDDSGLWIVFQKPKK